MTARYVQAADEKEKAKVEAEIHRLVVSRDRKYTSFIEFNHYKLVYRRYAGLFFTIAIDVNDNELVSAWRTRSDQNSALASHFHRILSTL